MMNTLRNKVMVGRWKQLHKPEGVAVGVAAGGTWAWLSRGEACWDIGGVA